MTPKEKAKEILYKMGISLYYSNEPETALYNKIKYRNEYNKECASIMIDEIISNRSKIHLPDKLYWQRVKQEIQKL